MSQSKRSVPIIHSLGVRVMLIATLAFCLMTGVTLYHGDKLIRSAMLASIGVTVKQTSVILNLAISPYAAAGNLETLSEFMGELLDVDGQYGVVYLVIARENGEMLAQVGLRDTAALPAADNEHDYTAAAARGILHVRQPLLLDHNEVGFLQYGLSSRFMLEASQSINRQALLLALVVFVSIVAVVILLGTRVVYRLNMLVSASRAIAEGDYARRVPVRGKDELARLAWNYNLMADSIKQRMEEITQLNQNLEKRVEERTSELRELNAALQRTVDDLEQTREVLVQSEKLASLGAMVAGVAHELNTPLGTALTVASTLQEKTGEFTAEVKAGLRRTTLDNYIAAAHTASDLILRNLNRASELVTSFKHVAVDQTSEQRRSFDLLQVVQEIVATLHPRWAKTPYRIEIGVPTGIVLDSYPGPLGQVVMNMVNNALAHAFHERTQGTLRISATRCGTRQVLLLFSDDGQGIAPENLRRVFDPFFTTRLGRGGSGLGLSIVHNLVHTVLGGSISVDSDIGLGTRFVVALPLIAPAPAPAAKGNP